MFAPRSHSVKKTRWNPSNGPSHNTSPAIRMHCRIKRSPRQTSSLIELWMIIPFSIFAMNPSRCYLSIESLNRLKILMKHIYDKHFDRTDVDDISLFHPHISLPMVFETFKAKLQVGILERKVDRRSRRLIYYCPFDFVVGTFPNRRRIKRIKHQKTCLVKVVCVTSKCRNRFCRRLVPRVVITIFPYGGGN